MKTGRTWFLAGVVALVMTGIAMVGCESTKSTSDSITLTPSSVTLTNATAVTFTATLGNTNIDAVLPLVWSVNDPSLGSIEGRGMTAVYTSTGKVGNNNVKVRDQADGEGIAVVNQVAPGESSSSASSSSVPSSPVSASALAVVPTLTTISSSETKVFSLSGGTSPYYCIPQYSALGDVSSINNYNKTVVYVASGIGTNTLTFTDSSSPVMSVTAKVIQN